MKRILAMVLALVMACSFTACGNDGNTNGTQEVQEVEITDSTELLTNVWAAYPGEVFSVMGGDYETSVMNQPGVVDITNQETMESLLGMPQEGTDLINDAASLMHMMNANTFTAGAYRLNNSEDVQALADIMKDALMNRQWLCGIPEKMIIASVGSNYVVTVIGAADLLENFKTALTDTYAATILYEEGIA